MEQEKVPYFIYEGVMARMERTIKRLSILLAVALFCIFISNAVWLYAWMQYDYGIEETTTVSQDGSGNNIYGNDNEVQDGTDNNNQGEEDSNKE